MKKVLMSCLTMVLAVTLCLGTFTWGVYGAEGDPADTYEKQRAEYEDESLSLWFEHSFKKVMTSDITPSGMDTYSVYMAKNEIENAQFVLYSEEQKEGMTASVTDFTNESGATLSAELYYQMYVTLENLNVTNVLGVTNAEDSIIREGEQPDPIAPLENIGAFQLNAGKSQAFYIRLKSTPDTPSGWYSGTLNIYNADGQQVKTAQVFAYVWNFALSEKTALETSVYVANDTTYRGNYEAFYDYLLENRINAMDVPGGLSADNPYLTNERVGSIRVTAGGGGAASPPIYMDRLLSDYTAYDDIYSELSQMDEWELIKDKFYFYTVDEPMSQEFRDQRGQPDGTTVDDVKLRTEALEQYWKDARVVVPYIYNTPYPYYYYDGPLSYGDTGIRDGIQEILDTDSVTIWCPMTYAFTPMEELEAYGYQGTAARLDKIRNLSGHISGNILAGQPYFNWESIYGDYYDRAMSYKITEETQGNDVDLWAYCCRENNGYTYTNHLIENTGLQTKLLFWQLYQNDVTGYLYYGANYWSESDANNGNFVDTTSTGSRTNARWKTNKCPVTTADGTQYAIYGDGVLFYGPTQGRVSGVDYIGTVRVEQMRDGIEEYQMLTMLEEYKGSDAAQAIVSKVSTNVVNYLSVNNFDTSAWDSSMDEYDIMAAVRLELGDAVEAAVQEGLCEHTYENGTVTVEAGCTTVGEMQYTCTKCGQTTTEIIPAKHTEGSVFGVETVTPVSCTQDGLVRYTCRDCGYVKEETVTAYHNDDSYYRYESRNANVHSVYCSICETELTRENHLLQLTYTNTCTEDGYEMNACRFCEYAEQGEPVAARGHYLVSTGATEPTCTEPGHTGGACIRCDYVEEGEEIPALGHQYDENGVCTVCGESEPEYIPGDVTGDGKVTIRDIAAIRQYLAGKLTLTDEQLAAGDVTGDEKITIRDISYLRLYLAGKLTKEI